MLNVNKLFASTLIGSLIFVSSASANEDLKQRAQASKAAVQEFMGQLQGEL